jgi:hypothetical protein
VAQNAGCRAATPGDRATEHVPVGVILSAPPSDWSAPPSYPASYLATLNPGTGLVAPVIIDGVPYVPQGGLAFVQGHSSNAASPAGPPQGCPAGSAKYPGHIDQTTVQHSASEQLADGRRRLGQGDLSPVPSQPFRGHDDSRFTHARFTSTHKTQASARQDRLRLRDCRTIMRSSGMGG